MLEDIRLTEDERHDAWRLVFKRWNDPPLHSDDSQYYEFKAEVEEAIADTATDKAIKKMLEWFKGTCQHRVPFHTRSQCAICKEMFIGNLRKLADEK